MFISCAFFLVTSSTSQCWSTLSPYQSFSYLLYPVYNFDIVDTAMLTNFESTLCLYRAPSFLFTSLTLPISQCWSISCRQRFYIISLISFSQCRHCRNCIVDEHRVDIMSTTCAFFLLYIFDNVDIAMLISTDSTSCLYRTSYILLTSSKSSQHRVYI